MKDTAKRTRTTAWTARAVTLVVAGLGFLVLAPGYALAATADLGVDVKDSADPVAVGTEFRYDVVVTNGGPEAANGVELVNQVPNQADVAGTDPSQGSCDLKGKKLSCALGTIANGADATVSIRIVPQREGQIVDEASVATADTDPVSANNTDTETTTVTAAPAPPTCAGQAATLVGTEGDDRLTGTDKKDVIVALGGNDVILGLGGDDLVCSAAGNDTIKGAAGNDEIRSGGGNDRLKGGNGRDALRAGGGADRLSGGAAADTLRGGGGADTCRGGPGKDVLRSC